MTENNGVLSWDSEIVKDSDFIVLPAGDYDFTVVNVERGQHEPKPGAKLPACPRAIVKLKIDQTVDPEITVQKDHYLFLHSMMESGLSEFFASIGMKEKGQPMKIDFDNVIGKKGKLTLKIGTYNGNETNDIVKLIPSYEVNKTGGSAAVVTGW